MLKKIDVKISVFKGLNMFLVPQVSVNLGISSSSKFYINLVIHL